MRHLSCVGSDRRKKREGDRKGKWITFSIFAGVGWRRMATPRGILFILTSRLDPRPVAHFNPSGKFSIKQHTWNETCLCLPTGYSCRSERRETRLDLIVPIVDFSRGWKERDDGESTCPHHTLSFFIFPIYAEWKPNRQTHTPVCPSRPLDCNPLL